MPPPYHDEHDEYLSRYLETGKARIIGYGLEIIARRKDGSLMPVDLREGSYTGNIHPW